MKPKFLSALVFVSLINIIIVLVLIYYQDLFFHSSFETCQTQRTNIVFLKTHKCAGSSIQNILMRYGDFRNLKFVLPPQRNYLSHPIPFEKSAVQRPWRSEYNILTHHTRLNYSAIKQIMPYDTVFVTIVRDPVSQFESAYDYYHLEHLYGQPLSNFDQTSTNGSNITFKRLNGRIGINQMIFDLGADSDIFYNDGFVNEYVDKLESWFDLVMVTERMDESLVLLKELMSWDLDDVVTFQLNARLDAYKNKVTVSKSEAIRRINSADQILYDRFLAKFERSVDDFGRHRMALEAFELKQRIQFWKDFCLSEEMESFTDDGSQDLDFKPKIKVFELRRGSKNRFCKALVALELPYTDYLREKQMARIELVL